MIQIERISIDDLDLLEDLWSKLNKHLEEKSSNFKTELSKKTFRKRLEPIIDRVKDGKDYILVAKDKGKIIGYMISSIDKFSVGEIDSIYVERDYRSSKIGKRFIESALEFFDKNNTEKEILRITEGNIEVENFYAQFDFQVRSYVLQRNKDK